MFEILLIVAAVLVASPQVNGHARLTNPPARTSAYFFGFPEVPPDYIDYQQNCGGYDVNTIQKGISIVSNGVLLQIMFTLRKSDQII